MTHTRNLFHHSSIPYSIIDHNKTIIDFSNQWLNTFDLDSRIMGQNFFSIMPMLPLELEQDIETCLMGQDQQSNSQRLVLDNGDAIWYHWKINAIDNGNGERSVLVVLEDITHKRLEEALNIKSQHIARVGGWEVDLVKNTLYWSTITKEIHEVPHDFVPDLETGIAFYKEGYSRDTIAQLVKEGMESGKKWDTELQIVTAKGNAVWVRAIGEPEMNHGKCVRILGTFQDIDKRKTTQLRLLKSEESLSETLKNSTIGMALVSLDGQFMDANPSLCSSLGYSKEELLGLSFQEITHPKDLEIDLSLLQELIDGKRSTYQIEKRYFNKDGELVYVILTVTAARGVEGGITHFISQIVDISARITTEQKLKSLLELTQSQNSSLLNFAHIVSHNLRSHAANLNMISNFLTDETLDFDTRMESLGMLGQAANGLNETIVHLNEVVQIQHGSDKPLQSVQLLTTIEKVLKDIQALIQENGVKVTMDVPPSIEVLAVFAYLESIVLNLVTNAIKYKDSAKEVKMMSIKAQEVGESVILSIEDNGVGIDLEKYGRKLFGMYKTFHGNEDARGIGLFITKNQIESMGGKIKVKSQPCVGTTFEVTLLKNQSK